MKKLILLALLPFCLAPAADRSNPAPLTTINFRGEELPVYAHPHPLQPKKISLPRYPSYELAAAIDGQAVLTLLVGPDGKVIEASVLSSEPTAAFGEAARDAAEKWRFKPQSQAGKPTKFIVQYPVNFKARNNSIKGPTMQLVPERNNSYEAGGRNP